MLILCAPHCGPHIIAPHFTAAAPAGSVPVVDQLYYNDLIDSGETGKILVQQLNGILSMLVMGPLVSYLQVAELLLGWSERFTADLGQAARVRAAWLVRGLAATAAAAPCVHVRRPSGRVAAV